jgi:sodium pump decarboxylase gamma subunit
MIFSVLTTNYLQDPTIRELIEFMLSGFRVVMVTLIFLSLGCLTIGYFFKKFEKIPHSIPQTQRSKSVQQAKPNNPENADEIVAVITAAVYQTLSKSAKIVKIEKLIQKNGSGSWALSGRTLQHSSHKLR